MNTTLQDNNYRHIAELKCCTTCKHSVLDMDWTCAKANHAYVSAIGICDKYEREDRCQNA